MIQDKSSIYSTYPAINRFSNYVVESVGSCCNLNSALFVASFALLGLAFEAVRTSLKGKLNKTALAIGAAIGIVLSISILFIRSYLQNKDPCGESEECCEEEEETNVKPQIELKKEPVIEPESSLPGSVETPGQFQTPMPFIAEKATLEECISDYVSSFLYPYLTGKITPENEPKNRLPLSDHLIAMIKSRGFQVEEKVILKLAIKAYAYEAARGIILRANATKKVCTPGSENFVEAYKLMRDFLELTLQNKNSNENLANFKKAKNHLPKTPDFNVMVNALEAALPKDFPSLKLSRRQIEAIALKRLSNFIVNSFLEEHEATTYSVAGESKDRTEKMERLTELKKTGKFFLDDYQEKAESKADMVIKKIED